MMMWQNIKNMCKEKTAGVELKKKNPGHTWSKKKKKIQKAMANPELV